MIFKNTTQYPTDECSRIIEFATAELEMHDVAVRLEPTFGPEFTGCAYPYVPQRVDFPTAVSARYLVWLSLELDAEYPKTNLWWQEVWHDLKSGEDPYLLLAAGHVVKIRTAPGGEKMQGCVFAHLPYGGEGAPVIIVNTWQEHLVLIAARHCRQIYFYRAGIAGSQAEAERWAERMLGKWRQVYQAA